MILWKNTIITRTTMFIINILVIAFMSIIIYSTIGLICDNNMARDFIEKIKYVPAVPWTVPIFSAIFLLLLFVLVVLREKYFKKNTFILYVFCIIDILLCIGIMFTLNMSYKGVLLIAIANVITYIDGHKNKSIFIGIIIIIYILLDYDIFSIRMNMFTINDYVHYYTSNQQVYIFSIRNILNSINEIVFILFMVQVIQGERDENLKITGLYGQLYKSSEELKVVNIQLQDYARKSEEVIKIKERNRLAREIHDTIGHTLTGIATGLEACIELSEINIDKMKVQIVKISELARNGLIEVRRSVSELRPDALERLSLISSVQKLSQDINECTNTNVNLEVVGKVPKLSPDEEETIYRVVQEGITNAVRHGNAKEINVRLVFNETSLQADITDDGVGCDYIKEGFGLKHIEERVSMLCGTVLFTGDTGKGFCISLSLPIRGKFKNDKSANS